ncbi:unnamed protein product [Blepharisma stoltei]|uniref:Uncharacterized protein n=1 Tax=Blepharisma stoltei TaxID=1481888 RepID=A0AAU9J510_9CILI|nr:unnamed protein product [Blepharisma stoltei]
MIKKTPRGSKQNAMRVSFNHPKSKSYESFQSFSGKSYDKSENFDTYLMSDNTQKRLRSFLEGKSEQSLNSPRGTTSSFYNSHARTNTNDSPPLKKTFKYTRKEIELPQAIMVKLNRRLCPHTETYKMRRLKGLTLLTPSKSQKGTLRFNLNQNLKTAKKKVNYEDPPEEHLLLGSENLLSSLYSQSIRIQKYLKNKNSDSYQADKKLSVISEMITQQQSKLAKSFYSL